MFISGNLWLDISYIVSTYYASKIRKTTIRNYNRCKNRNLKEVSYLKEGKDKTFRKTYGMI